MAVGTSERLVDAGEDAAVQQIFQQLLGAHVEFFGQLANGDAFGDGDVARSARLGRRDDRGCGAAVAHSGALARGMELALPFLFSFVGHRALRAAEACACKAACRAPPSAEVFPGTAATCRDGLVHEDRDACLWASARGVAQTGGRALHRGSLAAEETFCRKLVAADASAGQDADRQRGVALLAREDEKLREWC